MDDELSEDRVERPARERQFLCGRPDYLNARMAVASGGDEGFRRIDGCDGRSPNARDQLRGEGPGAERRSQEEGAQLEVGALRRVVLLFLEVPGGAGGGTGAVNPLELDLPGDQLHAGDHDHIRALRHRHIR